MSSIKNPPQLTDETNYEDWKNDLRIWQMFTEMEKKRQGPALYLSLTKTQQECCRMLDPDAIGTEGGFKLITDRLDQVYDEDVDLRTFTAFEKFHNFRRPAHMGMTEFFINHESNYHRLAAFNIGLPQGVQSFFLLRAANITEDNERLARVTCPKLKYPNMKETLMKICNDPSLKTGEESVPEVKMEPVYKVSHRGLYRGAGRGRGYGGRGYGRQYSRQDSEFNPRDRDGNIMECFKCKSQS